MSTSSSTPSGPDDDRWLVGVVCGQTHVTPPLGPAPWQDASAFLLTTPLSSHVLVFKLKSKRLITSTLATYEVRARGA